MLPSPRVLRATVLGTAMLTVLGCGSGASPSTAPTALPSPSATDAPTPGPSQAGSSAVVLEVTSEGGFISPVASLAALPTVVVYADGRILTPAGPGADLPDPLLPRVAVHDVHPAGVSAILAAIHQVGLDAPQTGDPGVAADSGTTVFTVTVDGTTTTSRFAAGGPGPGGPGIPGGGSGDPEKAAAFDLLGQLTDTTNAWGSSDVTDTQYVPAGYQVYVAPGDPGSGTTVAWPLAADPGQFGRPAVSDLGIAGLRTAIVLGADAATLGPVLVAATAGTGFSAGGSVYTVYARPLLPHELAG